MKDDDEDDDYIEGTTAADNDEVDDHEVEEDDDDDEAATDDDDEEECDGHEVDSQEVSDLFRSAASILTKRVLRDGTMADTQKRPGLTIHDIGLDEDDVQDVDYIEKSGELGKGMEAEEHDEDEDDDEEDDEEHDASDSDDAMDEVDEEEVTDIVVNAATVSLPSKDAIRLRGGKEIAPTEHELNLTARLQQGESFPFQFIS
ncbi:hypothetical protein HK405_012278 [Cladochytrium tenue]|nr:hypothetical protein HK405_012278 [Cladochytrium tenue]